MKNNFLFTLITILAVQFLHDVPAQNYTPRDTANLRNRDRMRQWSYENHQSSFPVSRKNNWSVGVNGGHSFIAGDIHSNPGGGFGLNVRHACGHIFSVRAEGNISWTSGQNTMRQNGFLNNEALNGNYNANANYLLASYPYVYHNFRSNNAYLALDAVFSLNNISFYNRTPKVLLYAFTGPVLFGYRTMVNAVDPSNHIYDYSGINPYDDASWSGRMDARTNLKNLLDDTWETKAEMHPGNASIGALQLRMGMSIGAGLDFRLSRRVSLNLEHRLIATFDDLVDGQRWQANNSLSPSTDFFQYTSVGLNFRIGKGQDAMWWSNPMEGPLNRIRNLEQAASKEDRDTDSDGVADAKDKEPNTPAGVKVDVKGVSLDSDEDRVPDYRDNEPFTPKGSQVDNTGKALDSDSDGVIDLYDKEINSPSGAQVDARGVEIKVAAVAAASETPASDLNMMMPLIYFDFAKTEVKSDFFPGLYNVARIMKENPNIKLRVVGHADNRSTDKYNIDLSKARANAVIDFMVKEFAIEKNRFMMDYQGAEKPIISGLPHNRDPHYEELHHLNRRVELEVVK